MSEEGGGKIKSKRQPGPGKPYERRKSFFGKVKDLITPSWLSGLVTNVKPPGDGQSEDNRFMNPEGRQQQNDTRLSLSMPPVFVPLDRRNGTPNRIMAPPQSTVISHAKHIPKDTTHTIKQDQIPLQSGFTSSQLPLIPEKVHDHFGDNEDNISDKSVDSKSTSGCSSMIPHPPSTSQKDRVTLELNESDMDNIKDKLLESGDKQKVGRSLTWTAQYNTKRPKKPALKGRPSFDISLFGSPIASNNTSLLSDRLGESTFYPGKTTYGGAASQRRLSLNAPYQSSPFPVRQKMKAKPMNNSFSATTSGTAKKILETLEKMTTPLGDARKIPIDDTVMQSLSSSFSFTPSTYRRPTRHSIGSYMNSSRELQIPHKGPPLRKVSTPGSASLATNLQRFTTPDIQKDTDATSSYQLPGSSQREPVMSSSNTQGGKMKNKKFSQHTPSRREEEEEQPFEIPNLRTDFTLPVKDMPSFNFNMPKSSPQFSARPESCYSQQYTFSSPLQKMPVTPTDTPTGPPKVEFKFSSPIQDDGSSTPKTKSVKFFIGDEQKESNFNIKAPSVSSNRFGESSISQGFPKSVSQPSSNSSPSQGGGLKVASELKTGSVMDILGKSAKSITDNKKSSDAFKNDSLSKFATKGWTCNACLVPNKEDADKCVACTSAKPKASSSFKNDSIPNFATKGWTCDVCLVPNKEDADKCVACTSAKPTAMASSSFKNDSLPKFATKGWTCGECLVPNKEDVDKCVACTSAKPKAKTGPSQIKNDSLAKFSAKGWTCEICLVSNKDDADKCVACTTAKPGLKKSLTKTQSSCGDSLQSMFKKQSGNWDCDVCLVPNKGEVTKCIACESPRPGTQPSSSGGLKIGPGAFSGQSGFVIGSNSNSNSGFKFGGDSSTLQTASGSKFGGSPAKSSDDSNKSDSATGFKFGEKTVKISDSDKPTSGVMFQNSVSESKNTTTAGGFGFGKYDAKSDKKTEGGFKFGETQGKSSEKSKSGFVFGNSVSDIKSSTANDGFVFGKPNASSTLADKVEASADKSDNISAPNSVSFGKLDSETKLSVTTSTVATTGLAFSSMSDSKNRSTSSVSGNLKFGQSDSEKNVSLDKKPTNGGFSFDPKSSSSKDNVKTNSLFGNNSKTDNYSSGFSGVTTSHCVFGSDNKTSVNSFTGTNNSGFSFGKQEENKGSENTSTFNSQTSGTSPSLKRGRDEETGPSDSKKPFAQSSTSSSSSLFQFGAKSTANTSSPAAGVFGQNKDSKPAGFSAPSFNFGGPSTTAPTAGFNASSQVTNTSGATFHTNAPGISTSTVFGSTAPASTTSGASFVFGSTKPATSTFGTTQQTPSIFGTTGPSFGSSVSAAAAPAFGSSGSTASFGSCGTGSTGVFGSTTPAFGSSSTNPQFGMPQTSSAPAFSAPQTSSVSAFGKPQATAQVFGTPQTTSFGTAAPPVLSSAPGGFNFSGTPSFNFGQPANTAQPAASVFQFGGPKATDTPQQPSAPAQTGGFNFGQTASTPAGGTPFTFNAAAAATPSFGTGGFGQPSTPQQGSAGIFTIGTGGTTENRKMKKAVRKIRR